jgi:hypothetical protein
MATGMTREPTEGGGRVDQDAIRAYVATTFPGTDVLTPAEGVGVGDTFFIYDPDRDLDDRQRFPYATIVVKNYGEFDNRSDLDRAGVFRLNVGIGPATFRPLFDDDDVHDYAALDRLMPHPVYARQSYVCVLNPSVETFEQVKPLLREAYEIAVNRVTRRLR